MTSVDPTPAATGAVPPTGYNLVWSDEFDGTDVDWSKWSIWAYEGSPLRGNDMSTRGALSVANGVLTLTVFEQDGLYHTAVLTTGSQYQPRYGYLEARINFNDSGGTWCGFWLQSPIFGQDTTAVSGAEIDVMEHRSNDIDGSYIANLGAVTIHYSGGSTGITVPPPNGIPLQGNWHTYGVLWTDSKYTWFIDRVPVWEITNPSWISQRTEEIRLSCEVQPGLWSGPAPTGGYGSLATSTTKMIVDYVRVWQP